MVANGAWLSGGGIVTLICAYTLWLPTLPDRYTITGSVCFSRYPGSVQVIFRVPGPTPLSGESVNQAEVVRALHVPSVVVVICIAEVSDTLTVVSVLSTVSCEDESPPPGPSLLSPQRQCKGGYAGQCEQSKKFCFHNG